MSTVQSIMQRDLVRAGADESVVNAVERLRDHDVGALLVVADDRLAGILSERDVLRRVIAAGRDPAATTVGEVATPDPVAVDVRTSLEDCTRRIRESGFRHLPVVDAERRPVGIISARDLLVFVVDGLEQYIARYREQQHREEMTDPFESLVEEFER